MIGIREETADDVAAIRAVNRHAFGQDQEGNIVDALRLNDAALLSLVATLDDRVVGHIMYSPATIGDVTGAALGPMAVVPEHQGRNSLVQVMAPFSSESPLTVLFPVIEGWPIEELDIPPVCGHAKISAEPA